VITEGLVDGKTHIILLDPAADIFLFPEEHVSQGARDGKNVCVDLEENGEKIRETGTVDIKLEGRV